MSHPGCIHPMPLDPARPIPGFPGDRATSDGQTLGKPFAAPLTPRARDGRPLRVRFRLVQHRMQRIAAAGLDDGFVAEWRLTCAHAERAGMDGDRPRGRLHRVADSWVRDAAASLERGVALNRFTGEVDHA